jgi:hypothetical protein
MANVVNRITALLKSEMETAWQNGGGNIYPYDVNTPEDKRRKPHALDNALKPNLHIMLSPELEYFEIGNDKAEEQTPHYHILEDVKIIRMPNRSTAKSRGSQAGIERSKRDYSVLGYAQGKTTVVQEYRQQIRRNYFGAGTIKTQPREYAKRKAVSNKNKRNYRSNKYFMYIERLIEQIVPLVASQVGATVKKESDETIAVGEFRNANI